MATPVNDPFRSAAYKTAHSTDITPRLPATPITAIYRFHSTPFGERYSFDTPTERYSWTDEADRSLATIASSSTTSGTSTVHGTSTTSSSAIIDTTTSTTTSPSTAVTHYPATMTSSPTPVSLGDGDFKPKPFRGNETDAEKTEQWLEYFTTYVAFRNITGPARIQLFRLLMADQAAEWWRSLPDDIMGDYDRLLEAFRRRYSLTNVERWRKATTIWQRDQKADESVATYITAIQNQCRMIPINDHQLIRFAIIRGLRPAIRLHVLQTNPNNMEELQLAAATAEASLSASGVSDDVAKLTEQVVQLVDQMNKRATIAAINSPGEEQRRVSFKVDEPYRDRPRSPSPYQSPMAGAWRRGIHEDRDRQRWASDGRERPYRSQSSANAYRHSYSSTGDASQRQSATTAWSPTFRRPTSSPYGHYQRSTSTPTGNACFNCGRRHPYGMCGAATLTCFKCGKVGHMAHCCRSMAAASSNSY